MPSPLSRPEGAAIVALWALATACLLACQPSHAETPAQERVATTQTSSSSDELRGPEAFADIADDAERSRALFTEAGRVLTHARCVNCHPADDRPRQGEDSRLHLPPVVRGTAGAGVAALQCHSCHQTENVAASQVPGAPHWRLAPLSMAWIDRSLTEICQQLKDPERNGGMTMAEMVEHATHDELVAWGWEPGGDLEPAPGDQATFGALISAWVASGAHCPPQE